MTDTLHSRRSGIIAIVILVGLGMLIAASVFGEKTDDPDTDFTGGVVRLGDQPAAMVNGSTIYLSDVKNVAYAQNLVPEGTEIFPGDPEFEQVLDELIDQRLMAQAAMNRSLDQQSEARRRLAQTRERVLGNILVEQHLHDTVNETTIRQMYDAQAVIRERGTEVRARHILLPEEPMAKEILRRLGEGESFQALAVAYSQDRASRESGGDLGYFSSDMLDPEFTRVAFDTPPGERVGPFKTQHGWHILEVLDRRKAKTPSYEDMREEILKFMTLDEIQKLLTSLRATAQIEKLDNTVSTVSPDLPVKSESDQ